MPNTRFLPLLLILPSLIYLSPSAQPVTESSSGFRADESSAGSKDSPSDSESGLSMSDRDLDKPGPLGPVPASQSADSMALTVLVDNEEVPTGDHCVIVEPVQDVTVEARADNSDAGALRVQGIAAMDLSKPREYEVMETRSTTWRMDRGALVRGTEGTMVWQAPAAADACRFEIVLDRQARFEDLSDTALQSAVQAKGVGGRWNTTFIVKAPYDPAGDGILHGYTVGIYPDPESDSAPVPVRTRPDAYTPPKFLIPVTAETARLHVSPHFRLGDFSPESERGKRHFIALDPRLVNFLEGLVAQLDSEGMKGEAIRILRAYVPPYQRQLLARQGVPLVEFTRYQYGDSASIILDADRNRVMDDLNGDGAVDVQDAERLAELADAVQRKLKTHGGIGIYAQFEGDREPATPCIQVDLRGWRQRWRSGEE